VSEVRRLFGRKGGDKFAKNDINDDVVSAFETLGPNTVAYSILKVYLRLVSGRSRRPLYFRGGKKVETVLSTKVGGNSGSVFAYFMMAELMARWLMWLDMPSRSKVMTASAFHFSTQDATIGVTTAPSHQFLGLSRMSLRSRTLHSVAPIRTQACSSSSLRVSPNPSLFPN